MAKGSFRLGTYSGIPLKLHWTFGLTFLLVIGIGIYNKSEFLEIGIVLILLMIMFLCVVLHEYGHALMAKKFDVKTIDIILSPIGGLARLERIPNKPIQEFLIALAGPMVNAVIAIIIAIFLYISSKPILVNMNLYIDDINNWAGYLSLILMINVALFVFNLIPAFPMDGGRILRALLSMKLGKMKSTIIATYIGYGFAIGFIIFSFYNSYYILSIIGLFVIIMARGELISAKQENFLLNNDVNLDALKNNYSFSEGTKMQKLISIYYDENASNFLIIDENENIKGIITKNILEAVIKAQTFNDVVSLHMEAELITSPEITLQSALTIMESYEIQYLVIANEEKPYIIEKSRIMQLLKAV